MRRKVVQYGASSSARSCAWLITNAETDTPTKQSVRRLGQQLIWKSVVERPKTGRNKESLEARTRNRRKQSMSRPAEVRAND